MTLLNDAIDRTQAAAEELRSRVPTSLQDVEARVAQLNLMVNEINVALIHEVQQRKSLAQEKIAGVRSEVAEAREEWRLF